MHTFRTKKYLILIAVAVMLSLVTIRWHSQDGVPFCVNSAGCQARETLRGKVTTTTYGYPAPYRQVVKFNPANTNEASGGYAGYKEARIETQKFSIINLAANILFWFALLHLASRYIWPIKQQAREAGPPTATPLSPSTDTELRVSQ